MEKRLLNALARLDAAFPAGDYKLNERQNISLNEILEISFKLAMENPEYKRILKEEKRKHGVWQIKKLVEIGLITKSEGDEEMQRRGFFEKDEKSPC